MAKAGAATVADYLDHLPPERRKTMEVVRKLVNKSLPRGYEEGILYGMVAWYVPLSRFADTYNGQPLSVACLAVQKDYTSLYLTGCYGDERARARLEAAYAKAKMKLNMGKSCLRFRSLDEVLVPAVEEALGAVSVEALVDMHERAHSPEARAARRAAKKAPAGDAKKGSAKKAAPAAAKKAAPAKKSPAPAKKSPTPKKAAKPARSSR
jgi:hypothetical protein